MRGTPATMKALLAGLLLIGRSVLSADVEEAPTAPPPPTSTVAPENDFRLAREPSAQPQKIGVLSYYPNNAGGYTFLEGNQIAFYVFRNRPMVYHADGAEVGQVNANGKVAFRRTPRRFTLFAIGLSRPPFGAQVIYRGEMIEIDKGVLRRNDMPIAQWTRDSPMDNFRLEIMNVDNETRLKLKSIVPVLERVGK
jgi:hypothetical protein